MKIKEFLTELAYAMTRQVSLKLTIGSYDIQIICHEYDYVEVLLFDFDGDTHRIAVIYSETHRLHHNHQFSEWCENELTNGVIQTPYDYSEV